MKLLLYCTKAKPWLAKMEYSKCDVDTGKIEWFEEYGTTRLKEELKLFQTSDILNGKIVAECDFDIREVKYFKKYDKYASSRMNDLFLSKYSCLSQEEIKKYLRGENGYAIHIKNLHIFDKPKELSEYYKYKFTHHIPVSKIERYWTPLTKAPQNMMYAFLPVFNKEMGIYTGASERVVLISIKPDYLCQILNGKKIVEVRKKVLKEMINNG